MVEIPDDDLSVVERFVAALENADMAGLDGCFDPAARIWHNFDQKFASVEENAITVRGYFKDFTKRDYVERRLERLPKGALLQFVIDLESAGGKRFKWPGCIVFEISGGRILKLEEYVDLSGLAAAMR